jgi:hypothetical protein
MCPFARPTFSGSGYFVRFPYFAIVAARYERSLTNLSTSTRIAGQRLPSFARSFTFTIDGSSFVTTSKFARRMPRTSFAALSSLMPRAFARFRAMSVTVTDSRLVRVRLTFGSSVVGDGLLDDVGHVNLLRACVTVDERTITNARTDT